MIYETLIIKIGAQSTNYCKSLWNIFINRMYLVQKVIFKLQKRFLKVKSIFDNIVHFTIYHLFYRNLFLFYY